MCNKPSSHRFNKPKKRSTLGYLALTVDLLQPTESCGNGAYTILQYAIKCTFEPIYGARGHFAGGAGVQTAFTAYDTYDTTVVLSVRLNGNIISQEQSIVLLAYMTPLQKKQSLQAGIAIAWSTLKWYNQPQTSFL